MLGRIFRNVRIRHRCAIREKSQTMTKFADLPGATMIW
jgi:hypothetical protein